MSRQEMSQGVLRYFHPVLPSRALGKRPVQIMIADRKYVLFRDASDRAAALDDQCPHRHASLSGGSVRADGRLACPYHGWSFDAEGNGRSPSDPQLTRCDTRAYQVLERFGHLWIASRETSPSTFPGLRWKGFDFAGSVSITVRAPMDVTLDNISEDEHFPFVHTTFGWDENALAEVSIQTNAFADHSEVSYSGRQRATFWAALGGVRPGDQFHNQWSTRFDPVHTIYTFGWKDPHSGRSRPITTRAAVFLVPETSRRTRIDMFLFLKIAPSIYSRLGFLMHGLARHVARMELRRDVRLIENVADAPGNLEGMRLTRFDHALIYNRKLLHSVYWSNPGHPGSRETAQAQKAATGSPEDGEARPAIGLAAPRSISTEATE
jgi:phenylpropionate dioxygenase-like ring-hydroxylating dioxygenase large terminal subunit